MRVSFRLNGVCAAFAVALAVLPSFLSAATVSGRVRDASTSSYLLGATVTLRELNRETGTGSDGAFSFPDVPPGNYTLVAGSLGYGEKSETVSVTASGARAVDFALASDVLQLGAFVVEGAREG